MGRNKIVVDINKVKELIDKGYTQIQISKELEVGKNTIVRILQENNLQTKSRYEDLVGKVFGKLTVIKRLENTKDRRRLYLCKCECGNLTKVKSKYLTNGDTRSCGCYKNFDNYQYKNYHDALSKIGEKHGRLTIIDIEKNAKKNRYYMICRCECGKITKVFYSALSSGKSFSCGCYAREESSKRMSNTCHFKLYNQNRWYFVKKSGEKVNCRSGYEVIYANYLIMNDIDFEYEPETFKLCDGKRYTPDFYLPYYDKYIEIKGIEYEVYDKGNQKERFELFSKNHDIELYYWEDLCRVCKLKCKWYGNMLKRAKRMNLNAEDYIGNRLYL